MARDSTTKAIVILLAIFFTGLGMLYHGIKKYMLLQKIKNTPTSKAESVALGLTELYGAAKCAEDAVSPISKARCVYWRVHAQYYKSGKGGGWRTIYDYSFKPKFFVEDDSGRVLADLDQAQVEIPSDQTYQGYISGHGVFGVERTKMDDRVLAFIDGLDAKGKQTFIDHENLEVRVEEYFIAEGDKVYVLGTAQQREGMQGASHSESVIVQWSSRDKLLYVTDSEEKKITKDLRDSSLKNISIGLGLSAICLFLLLLIFKI